MLKEALLLTSIVLSAATTVWAQADPALIAKGEKIFSDKKCVPCHAIKGKGGTVSPMARGPDLSSVGAQREARWLRTYLKDPKVVNPKAKMMPF